MQQQHRDRYDIVRNILEIVCNTRPIYRNQMDKDKDRLHGWSYTQTVEYLDMLLYSGLLVVTDIKSFFSYCEIIGKGLCSYSMDWNMI